MQIAHGSVFLEKLTTETSTSHTHGDGFCDGAEARVVVLGVPKCRKKDLPSR